MKTSIALQDKPLGEAAHHQNIKELDTLGLSQYVDALSQFIQKCGTPMTIAVQGDWGTGKTSLMRLIQSKLDDDIETIWFNTWQYSQFSMGESLPLSFVRAMSEQVTDGNKVFDAVKGIAKVAAEIGARTTSIGAAALDSVNMSGGGALIDSVQLVRELKGAFEKACEKKLQKQNKSRIVVFIDDLDRIRPQKAIELLETLKIFLDVEHCVFVLAMDFKVVQKGLTALLGEEADEKMTRSFFDKIIQLPFKMPVDSYNVENYLKDLLKQVDIDVRDEQLNTYKNILVQSIGMNPRATKRIINVLILMKIVSEAEDKQTSAQHKLDKDLALFLLVCMQESYPKLYSFIAQNIEEESLFAKLSNFASGEEDNDLEQLLDTPDSRDKLGPFISIFINVIDTDGNGEIDDEEVADIQALMGWVSITSVEPVIAEPSTTKRHLSSQFCMDLSSQFKLRQGLDFTTKKTAHRAKEGDNRRRCFDFNFSPDFSFKLLLTPLSDAKNYVSGEWELDVLLNERSTSSTSSERLDLYRRVYDKLLEAKPTGTEVQLEKEGLSLNLKPLILNQDASAMKALETLCTVHECLKAKV